MTVARRSALKSFTKSPSLPSHALDRGRPLLRRSSTGTNPSLKSLAPRPAFTLGDEAGASRIARNSFHVALVNQASASRVLSATGKLRMS